MKKTLICFLSLLFFSAYGQQGLNVYFGNLHSHTSNSDGSGTPYQAYTFARDSAHLDFLAVTDHVEYLSFITYNTALSTALSMTQDSVFVAIYGYEWTSYYYGHCDVFATTEMVPASSSSQYPGGWDILNSFVRANPPAFGQFNHPGRSVAFNNWDDFAYVNSSVDSVFPLIEFQNPTEALNFYEKALSRGWHLSPVWNQDNHYGDWGLKNHGRAGIWATDLTRTSLFSAIRNRRTFATMDFNASVWTESGTTPMGSVMPWVNSLPLHVVLNDTDTETWYSVEIVTDKGVLETFYPSFSGNIDTIFTITDTVDWVFVRAMQTDADMVWSAPVFFETATAGYSENQESGVHIIFNNGNLLELDINSEQFFPLTVIVTDAAGRNLYSYCITEKTERISIDISGFTNGVYNINIRNSTKSFSDKFVISGD